MDILWRVICAAVTVALAYLLWPVIKWLAAAVLVVGFVLVVYLAIASRKTRDTIAKDPDSYFARAKTMEDLKKHQAGQGDVIEAEYTERTVDDGQAEQKKEEDVK